MAADLIAGRYRVLRAIGRGAMGTVWLCTDELLNRDVAVKQIGALPGEPSVENARAMREARSAAALNHENAVSIFDVVDHDGTPWLVMEYVEGKTLADVIRDDGPIPPERVAAIGAQLADALAQAHQLGIVHRDVKPANVMMTADGRAKISDFGIARHDQDEQLTQIGMVTGTPAYFAPELARGAEPSRPADVYALGATLYAAVEGRTPYESESNPINLLRKIDTTQPRPVHHAGPLRPALAGLMAPDPESRWTMIEAGDRLRAIADGRGIGDDDPTRVLAAAPAGTRTTPQPTPAPEPESTPGRRRTGWLVPAAILLLALILGVGAYLLFTDEDPNLAADRTGDQTSQPPTSQPPTEQPSDRPSEQPSDRPSEQPSEEPSEEPNDEPTEQPSEPATSEPAPTTAPPDEPDNAPENGGPVSEGEMADFVSSYFALLPEDTDAGWAQLSSSYQQEVGRGSYDGFWGTLSDVQADNIDADTGEMTATLDITYVDQDGGSQQERHVLDLVEQDGELLIDGDEAIG